MEILKVILVALMAGFALSALVLITIAVYRNLNKLSRGKRILIIRFFSILLSLLIFVSLFTYTEKDYIKGGLFDFTPQKIVLNRCGVVGAFISHILLTLFGTPAYIIPFLLFICGVIKLQHYEKFLFWNVYAIVILIFLDIIFGYIPNLSGGLVGSYLLSFLVKWLGTFGTYILLFFIFMGLLYTIPLVRKLRRKIKVPQEMRVVHKREKRPKIKPEKIEPEKITQPLLEKRHRKLLVGNFTEKFLSILHEPEYEHISISKAELDQNAQLIEKRFEEFGVSGKIINKFPGPVVTRYEYKPAPGIKVSKIESLTNDIALSMKASRVRIVAPIPGSSAIGIEVPNATRKNVYLKQLLQDETFIRSKSKLTTVMGVDIAGLPYCSDIQTMPHVLIAGATGSGKSVFINTIIASILSRAKPCDVRFIMIDPKRIELPVYNSIPHLICPVIADAKKALDALKGVLEWMDIRYREFARAGVRDIEGYNKRMNEKKPYIVIIVDELADLMLTAPREIEETLTRLAQMSRAVGIHLVLATQRPSVDVITGLIKANFPARVAFQVASKTDSRTILDMNGAEKLLGRGDMLFLPPGKGEPERLHGAYISTEEAKEIANLWAERWLNEILYDIESYEELSKMIIDYDLVDAIVKPDMPGARERIGNFTTEANKALGIDLGVLRSTILNIDYYPPLPEMAKVEERIETQREILDEFDELFDEAKRLVIRHQVASVSLLQRHFKIGYARAGRIIDQLERSGIIGPYQGSKSRDVLIDLE
ncbi:DNA translocase FtsK 4TM domain-containing protein [candidate division WOR-3 bacterium]|nr:DNA translocase FtsK 4TM domain-containing protein [candidate division WOR-3 bacterium]